MDTLIQQQRLQHMVDSYALAGDETELFAHALLSLLETYPGGLVEWALVEVLVDNWLRYPLPRGLPFCQAVQERLAEWQTAAVVSTFLTADQFEQVTGLTPQGVVGNPVRSLDAADARRLVLQRRLGDRHDPAN